MNERVALSLRQRYVTAMTGP